MRTLKLLPLILGITLAGCGDKPVATHDHTGHDHTGHSHDSQHTHGDGQVHTHDVAEVDPVPAGGGVGMVMIGDYKVAVGLSGEIKPGGVCDVSLKVDGPGQPEAIRLWIGDEQCSNSVKAKAHSHGESIDAHVEIPDPLVAGSDLWIEVQTESGKQLGSFGIE